MTFRLKKIIEAEKLYDSGEHGKAISVYKEICLNTMLSPTTKIEALSSFVQRDVYHSREILIAMRDSYNFMKDGDAKENVTDTLKKVCQSSFIEDHERGVTAVMFYNSYRLDVCYDCFSWIARDENVSTTYRVDMTRYLFGSDNPDKKEVAIQVLIPIIKNVSLDSSYRYSIIAGFTKRNGVSAYLNKKIRIPYDENFVYSLQKPFFFDDRNGIRERILSGQHLLQMSIPRNVPGEIQDIEEVLMNIMKTNSEENIRADAADVLIRLGTEESSSRARDAILEMGHSGSGVKTIYNNSQNIHVTSINKTIQDYIKTLMNEPSYNGDLKKDLSNLIIKLKLSPAHTEIINKVIDRIYKDTALFSDATLTDILNKVWSYINRCLGEQRMMLETRLIQEFLDMEGTCSSGHAGRLVNVLSGIEVKFNIGFEEQIKSNISGRIISRINKMPDEDVKMSLTMGMLKDANQEDKTIYLDHITKWLSDLRTELKKEFVDDGYIASDEFYSWFDKHASEWIPK